MLIWLTVFKGRRIFRGNGEQAKALGHFGALIFLEYFFPPTRNTHILFHQQSSNRKLDAVEMNGRASLKKLKKKLVAARAWDKGLTPRTPRTPVG